MTEPDPKRVLQAALLERAAQWGKLEGWYIWELAGRWPYEFGEATVLAWIAEVVQPLGDPLCPRTWWVERVNAEVSR